MLKATRDIAKSPRRPRSKGTGEPVLVRLQPDLSSTLDCWRREQDDLPSRAEAIRRLVQLALQGAQSRAIGNALAERAAGNAIDKALEDSSQPDLVKAERKRRLTKMPRELKPGSK